MGVFVQVRRDSAYLDELLGSSLLDGVIANIAYSYAPRMQAFVKRGGRLLVDPSTHLLHVSDRKLGSTHFRQLSFADGFSGLGALSAEGIGSFVAEVIGAEVKHGATEIISPYFFIHEMRGPALELSLAASYESRVRAEPMGINTVWTGLMVSGDEIKRPLSRDWFLTRVTKSETDNCYLIVDSDQTGWGPLRDVELIEGLREVVRVFSENDIKVLLGYADTSALGLTVDGLYGFATGPTVSARRFDSSKVRRGPSRARRPAAKYYLRPIMNFLRNDGELATAVKRGALRDYACRCGTCPGTLESALGSTNAMRAAHYLRGLHDDTDLLQAIPSKPGRLAFFRQILDNASTTYDLLRKSGVTFDTDSGPGHIEAWRQAFG